MVNSSVFCSWRCESAVKHNGFGTPNTTWHWEEQSGKSLILIMVRATERCKYWKGYEWNQQQTQNLLQPRLCCRFLDRSKSFSVRRSEWRPYVRRQEGTLRTGLPNKGLLRTTRKSTNCPLAPAWSLSLHFWDCVAVIIPSTSSFQVGLWLANV